MKQGVIFVLLLLTMMACQKNKPDESKTITYTGYIYHRADSTQPYNNASFICYQYTPRSSVKAPEEEITPFTTDENGYFSVSVKLLVGYRARVFVCWPDGIDNNTCPNQCEFNTTEAYNNGNNVGKLYMP